MKSMRENLILLNIPRAVVVVIEVLSDGKSRALRDIERDGDLRQPEVSIAVGLLSDYLIVESRKKPGKGRSEKVVTMNRKAYCDYIDACVDGIRAKYDIAATIAEELKESGEWRDE